MNVVVQITEGPLSEHTGSWAVPGAGALIAFSGRVRGLEDGQPISGLTYTAYRPMADEQLQQLAERVAERTAVLGIIVEHSIGFVPAGRCSFRLQVAAAHRKAAIRCVDEFIDEMKRDIPIWKEAVGTEAKT